MAATNPFAPPAQLSRLQVEITTGCNLHCAGCQRTVGMAAHTWHNGHMPVERFGAILANAPPADAIVLQGIGEPTLHPALPRFVTMARAAGKFGAISFNTNGLARELDYYRNLRDAGLNHISVSVDSLDPASAEATRAGTDCRKLEAAIAGLLTLFGPGLTLSVVVSRRNADGLSDLLHHLYRLGGRMVEIQPLIAYETTNVPFCLQPTERAELRRQATATAAGLPGLRLLLAAALTPNGTRCRRPFHAAYATLDGSLTPCCTTNDAALYGDANLAAAPFHDLWQQAGIVAWMQSYLDREPQICRGCAFNPLGASADRKQERVAEGERLLREGNNAAAETVFRNIIGTTDDAAALHGAGIVRLQDGDHSNALPWLQVAHQLTPDPRHGHNLAVCLRTLGRTDEALTIERDVAASAPAYFPAQLSLADMLCEHGDVTGAVTTLLKLGELAVAADTFAVAVTVVERLAALPASGPAVLRLADLLRFAGREDLAVQLAQAVLRRDPADISAALELTMSRLAIVHASQTEIAERRLVYTRDLQRLAAASGSASEGALTAAAPQVGNTKPFFLAYQGQNDRYAAGNLRPGSHSDRCHIL